MTHDELVLLIWLAVIMAVCKFGEAVFWKPVKDALNAWIKTADPAAKVMLFIGWPFNAVAQGVFWLIVFKLWQALHT